MGSCPVRGEILSFINIAAYAKEAPVPEGGN